MSGADLVLAVGALVAAPSPSDGQEFNSVTVSPGLPGFFAMFVLSVAVVLLAVDMTRRTRRVQAKARVQERMEAAERARQEQVRAEDGSRQHGTGQDGTGQDGTGGDGAARDEMVRDQTDDDTTAHDGTAGGTGHGEDDPADDRR